MLFDDIKVFCINLERRPERLAHIEKEFAAAGITDYTIIPAVDGLRYDLSTKIVADFLKDKNNPNGYIPAGWIANFITYRNAFFWISQLCPDKNVLIFEDDATLKPNFKYHYIQCLSALPEDWDVLFSGVWDWFPDKAMKVNQFINAPHYPILAHCVLYTPKAMREIFKEMETMKCTFDVQIAGQLYATRKLKAFSTVEKLAEPCMSFSSDGSPYLA